MKWFIRGILLVIFLFIGTCIVGFFLPAVQTSERSVEINAHGEDVFARLNDLRSYAQWSPLQPALQGASIIYGGPEMGVGQSMVWKDGRGEHNFGAQEILQSSDLEFVQLSQNLAGRELTVTHAILAQGRGEGVIVLTKTESALGGFPYLSRVRAKLKSGAADQKLDAALSRLKTLSETR